MRSYFFDGEILEIVFDLCERLIVFEPSEIVNTNTEFSVYNAKKIKWSWYPYGSAEKEMKNISHEFREGKVYKISKYGEQLVVRKSSLMK